jgi:hypothetical protein
LSNACRIAAYCTRVEHQAWLARSVVLLLWRHRSAAATSMGLDSKLVHGPLFNFL